MLPFVLDASVLSKLAIEEPGGDEFFAWMQDNAAEELQAPSVAFSEVGRAIQKANPRGTAQTLARLHERALEGVKLREPAETARIWEIAQALTFADAEYVRLAQRLGAVLITSDTKMAERARKAGVQVKEF